MPVYDGYEIDPEDLPGKRKRKDRKGPSSETSHIPHPDVQPSEGFSDSIHSEQTSASGENTALRRPNTDNTWASFKQTVKSKNIALRWLAVGLCGVIVTGLVVFFLGRQHLAEPAARYALAHYDKHGVEDLPNLYNYATLFGENYKRKLAAGLYERTAATAMASQGDCTSTPDRIIANGEYAVQYDPKQKSNWGKLLFKHLERCPGRPAGYDRYCAQVLAWSPDMRPQLAILSMKHLMESIRNNDAESAEALAKQVIDMDHQQKDKVAAVFWKELSDRMLRPDLLKDKRKENFMKFATIFLGMEIYPEKGDEAGLLCLNALLRYFENDKESAIKAFQELRAKHGDSPFSEWNRIILSLSPGTREYKTDPIQIKDRNHRNVAVRLLRIHISESKITLTLGFQAGDTEVRVPYAYGHWKSHYVLTESGEPLYIVDDFGKKFYGLGSFQGGRQYAHSIDDIVGLGRVENAAVLYISPHEESVVSVSFPIISEGATKITFVSPKVAGMRDDWFIKDIPLKDHL